MKTTVKESRSPKLGEGEKIISSKRPKVVIRRSAKQNSKIQFVDKEQSGMDTREIEQVRTNLENANMIPTVSRNEWELPLKNPSTNDPNSESLLSPTIPGFDLDGVSRNQHYVVRNMLVLCDCCVQQTPDGVFDVLARNFGDTGALMWWLRKIGKARVAELVKGKDLVDAIRKAAHKLYRDLRSEIGQQVARW